MALLRVVKYNGGPNVFAWKYPDEELNTWTQLIVNESQEAVLFKGGKALDVFPSGRHTLETSNIPGLRNLINLPFGKRSPFTAEIWYINIAHTLDIKWGTTSPIQLQDPKYSIFIPVRAFGQFGITIENSKQFLAKLVGTLPILDKNSIGKFFRGLYLTKVKDAISTYLINKQISIMEINAYIDELSEFLLERIQPVMAEYGIKLVNFYVNDISVPEDDSAVKKLKDALAKKAEMTIIGFDYQQERSFDTLEGAAKNPGSSSNLMGAGLGLGMGVALGGPFGNQMSGVSNQINTQSEATKACPKCNTKISASTRFCSSCGYDTLEHDSGAKEKVSCDKCASSFSKAMKFCPECGDKYNPCPNCAVDLAEGSTVCDKCKYEFPIPCPDCGASIHDKNVKFCPECGKSLLKTCQQCHAPLKGNDKFCPECGTKTE